MGGRGVVTAAAFGPASMSNLGPGFDTLGICIRGYGDTVTATITAAPEVSVQSSIPLPSDPGRNSAARAAQLVLQAAGADCSVHLEIDKGIPLGSGIGGSAASAVAGAWATNLVLGSPLEKSNLVEAVLEGEAVASGGARHGDNALPALFGGMVLTSPRDAADYRLIPLCRPLYVALLLPKLAILTAPARDILPEQVSLRSAVENASDLAFLMHGIAAGDYEEMGVYMMRDRLVEPVRSKLLPFYDQARARALAAGAWACAITGSGPAMFALAPSRPVAEAAAAAMVHAATAAGTHATGVVTEPDLEGVRAV